MYTLPLLLMAPALLFLAARLCYRLFFAKHAPRVKHLPDACNACLYSTAGRHIVCKCGVRSAHFGASPSPGDIRDWRLEHGASLQGQSNG
jgi:hypothetical protein